MSNDSVMTWFVRIGCFAGKMSMEYKSLVKYKGWQNGYLMGSLQVGTIIKSGHHLSFTDTSKKPFHTLKSSQLMWNGAINVSILNVSCTYTTSHIGQQIILQKML